MILRICAISLIAMLISFSASAAEFEVAKGHLLWHEWVNTYEAQWSACSERLELPKGQRLDWNRFERVAAQWNTHIGSVERFRHLKAGTVVKIPPSRCEMEDREAEIHRLKSENSALASINASLTRQKNEFAERIKTLQTQVTDYDPWWHRFWRGLAVVLMFILVVLLVLTLFLRRRRVLVTV